MNRTRKKGQSSALKRITIVQLVVQNLGLRIWALAISLVSSVGILPAIYLTKGRKTH